nr:glycosyltransferase family 39 protein [Modestobacter versicolor]
MVAEDVHPPLYHVLLRTWRLVLGPDVETARALSLVFLLASVPMVYLVARSCLTRPWALFAVVVFSCSPFAQWYGNEARMYSMLLFLTLVSQYAFLKVIGAGRTSAWVGYAVAAAAGLYVHYFFGFVLVAQGLYVLALHRRLGRGAVLRMAGVAVFVAAAIAPWYLYFRAKGSASGTRPSLPSPSSVDFSNVYSQFLFGFQSDAINTTVVSAWPLLVLAALAGVRIGGKLDRTTGYLIVAAFVPVLLAFVVSHAITPFFLSRYMAPALPALLVIVVVFISGLTKPVARVLAVGLLAITIAGTVVQAANPDTPVQEDYRTAAELAEQASPSDLVVISSPFTVYPFEYYYDGAARVTTLPVWNRQLTQPTFDPDTLPEDVAGLAAGHQYVYLLLSYDQGYEDTVYQYFAGNFEQTAAYSPSPGLQLLVYRVGYSAVQPVAD